MKNKSILSVLFFLLTYSSFAQDIIYKNDRTEVKSKIIEVQENDIKYKKFEFLDGPTYTMSKSDIYMIIYKNGQKEIFENIKTVETNNNKEKTSPTSSTTNKTSTTREIKSSEYTLKRASFIVFDLGVAVNNFSDYDIPNIAFSGDVFLRDNIAFQSYAGFSSLSSEASFSGITIKTSAFNNFIGIGGKYYFNELLKLNQNKYHVYAGAVIGYSMTSVTIESNSPTVPSSSGSDSEVGYFGQIGGRYLFSNHWGVKTELQFGKGDSSIIAGLSYRWTPKTK